MKKSLIFFLLLVSFFSFKERELKWVAIGDSITYLNDHLDETGNRVTKGYMTLVTERNRNVKYINKGYNGWTAGSIAEKFESLNIEKADIYTVFLGTNDWWQGRPIGTFEDYRNNTGNSTINGSFRIIIDKIKALNNYAKIVLIAPMKRTDFVYIFNKANNAWGSYKAKNGQELADVANALKEIGAYERITVIDLFNEKKFAYKNLVKFKKLKNPATGQYRNFKYPEYTNISFDPSKDGYPYPKEAVALTYDGLHPSDAGYKIIAEKVIKAFKRF